MMEGRRGILINIGVVAIALILLFAPWSPLRTSGESVWLAEVPNTEFVCDGPTDARDQVTSEGIPACGAWGVAILNDELEYPEGVEAADIKQLEMEQALWGFVDRCTVTAYVGQTTFEQEVPCWDDSLSEPSPY